MVDVDDNRLNVAKTFWSYKIHVNVLVENEEKIYKLYFKNNIENSEKSLMEVFKTKDANGNFIWARKAFCLFFIN
jgi:hypothetical protein